MKIKETILSACAVAAMLAGTAACTSDGDGPTAEATAKAPAQAEPAADTTCKDGTYSWFNVDQRDVLTGVAEKEKVGKKGARLKQKLTPLHTPRTAVTFEEGSPAGDAKAALHSLALHIGEADADDDGETIAFTDVRRPAPDLNDGSATLDGAGTFVQYAWVKQVTADFRYTCGDGKPVTGRATGWAIDASGLLECSTPIESVKGKHPALAAARLSCGPDAPAAKTTT